MKSDQFLKMLSFDLKVSWKRTSE